MDGVQAVPRCVAKEGTGGLPEGQPLLDPQISSDASTVAFVCDNDVWVVDAQSNSGEARKVTSGAAGTTRGLADYLAQVQE